MSQPLPAEQPLLKSAKTKGLSPAVRQLNLDAPAQSSAPVTSSNLSHAAIQRALANPRNLAPNDMLQLQRTVGNQAVSSMLRGQSGKTPAIQRKLHVGPANDKYEVEAEQMAGKVAQRQSTGETFAPDGGVAPQEVEQGIRSAHGGGSSLPKGIRRSMEESLGTDLGNVRLHTDGRADKLNRSLSAKAFTTGTDLFFRKGEYQPESKAGRSLLAHELTHVKQQSGKVQRAISDKQDQFEGEWKTLFPNGNQGANSKAYVDKFNTKPTDKGKRKEQKREQKALKKLLHYKKGEDRVDDAARLRIRALLTAEAGAGANMATLAEFKEFLSDKYKDGIHTATLTTYWKPDGSGGGAIAKLVKLATEWGASDDLMNLFYSHSAEFRWKSIGSGITALATEVRSISTRAENAAKTGDPQVTGMLSYTRRQMLRQTAQLEQFKTQRNLYRALPLLPTAKENYLQVLQFTLHAERRAGAYNEFSEDKNQKAKLLGGGNFSKVYKVHYDKKLAPDPNKVKMTKGVFKQELTHYGANDAPAAQLSGIQQLNPDFTARSVATYKLDKLLGMGVTPKTKAGTHGGLSGSVQDWVEGKAPQKSVTDKKTEATEFFNRDFNMDDPEIQRQLSTLQLLDIITGQVDRHDGNYFIYQGPNGTQVKSIDNDLAFGKDKGIDRVKTGTGAIEGKDSSRGLPLFVDRDVAKTVMATKPNQLKEILEKQGLSTEEINKTLERFALVQQHIRDLEANSKPLQVLFRENKRLTAARQNTQRNWPAHMDDHLGNVRQQIRTHLANGALLGKDEWDQVTAQYSTLDNSYYGRAVHAIEDARKTGKLIDKDDD